MNVYNRMYLTDWSQGETEVFHNNRGAGSKAKEGMRIKGWYETAIAPDTKRNLWGREIYPKCMYNTLMEIRERYGDIPVYIPRMAMAATRRRTRTAMCRTMTALK